MTIDPREVLKICDTPWDDMKPSERIELKRLARRTLAAEAELQTVEAWIHQRHNGYDAEARAAIPELKEPATLVAALEELEEEHEQLFESAIEKQVAAEAENADLKARIAQLVAEGFDVPAVLAWQKSSPRKQAIHAFTAGPERQAAYLIESERHSTDSLRRRVAE